MLPIVGTSLSRLEVVAVIVDPALENRSPCRLPLAQSSSMTCGHFFAAGIKPDVESKTTSG